MTVLTGGSDAIVELVEKGSEKYIQKKIPLENSQKLKAQMQWLQNFSSLGHFSEVESSTQDKKFFYLNLKYIDNTVPFFDFIHQNDLQKSKDILRGLVVFMRESFYSKAESKQSSESLERYIDQKFIQKVNACKSLVPNLEKVLGFEMIVVNGKELSNIGLIEKELRASKEILDELVNFDECEIHGDLAVDNILIKSGDFIVLDPNDENFISDPIVDYAKIYQSFRSNYEFLLLLDNIAQNGNQFNFEVNPSKQYRELFSFIQTELLGDLTEKQKRAVIFHEAVHYSRMLPYRAKDTPKAFFAFYCTMIERFNEFLKQYR